LRKVKIFWYKLIIFVCLLVKKSMQNQFFPTEVLDTPPETKQTLPKKSLSRRLAKDLCMVFLLAVAFRWLVMEAYTIPTASMEGTLWRGDFILVSKWHYGARTPNTWLQLPLTFRKIWFTSWNSYIDLPTARLPITRLPALTGVQRNDLVVFNYPRELSYPIELRTPYIKRCVAVGGDTLLISGGEVFVNGKPIPKVRKRRYRYFVRSSQKIPDKFLKQQHWEDSPFVKVEKGAGYLIDATRDEISVLGKLPEVQEIIIQNQPTAQHQLDIYPHTPHLAWNEDNFGAVIIPKKGMTIPLSQRNVWLYGQAIKDYEIYGKPQKVVIKQNILYINGVQARHYTFQQDYFFMLGDNFHNSADSRFWGFVPQDHIIGKAFYIGFSLSPEKQVRWDRTGSVE
jgi:signal peptidase I